MIGADNGELTPCQVLYSMSYISISFNSRTNPVWEEKCSLVSGEETDSEVPVLTNARNLTPLHCKENIENVAMESWLKLFNPGPVGAA